MKIKTKGSIETKTKRKAQPAGRSLTVLMRGKETTNKEKNETPEEYAENRFTHGEEVIIQGITWKTIDGTNRGAKALTELIRNREPRAGIKSIIKVASKMNLSSNFAANICLPVLGVLIVIVVVLFATIICSSFGIFYSSETNGERMCDAVKEIENEYQSRIASIVATTPHDELILTGGHIAWREILALYAVKTTNDKDDPMQVATVNSVNKEKLRAVFWRLTEIETITTERSLGTGDEEETIVTLQINVLGKSTDDGATIFSFDENQNEQLEELLNDNYKLLWLSVIYGIQGGKPENVEIALSQIGNIGGDVYWRWYGYTSRVDWCACFVSWCCKEAGLDDVPAFSSCSDGIAFLKEHNQWEQRSVVPEPGMLIFFDWDDRGNSGPQDGVADHVGIVVSVNDGVIETIEGNSGDAVRMQKYSVEDDEILGYGITNLS